MDVGVIGVMPSFTVRSLGILGGLIRRLAGGAQNEKNNGLEHKMSRRQLVMNDAGQCVYLPKDAKGGKACSFASDS